VYSEQCVKTRKIFVHATSTISRYAKATQIKACMGAWARLVEFIVNTFVAGENGHLKQLIRVVFLVQIITARRSRGIIVWRHSCSLGDGLSVLLMTKNDTSRFADDIWYL